jgi:hypothetical protein
MIDLNPIASQTCGVRNIKNQMSMDESEVFDQFYTLAKERNAITRSKPNGMWRVKTHQPRISTALMRSAVRIRALKK